MKGFIMDMVFPIIYGALIGLTIGIADVLMETPVNISLLLTHW